MRNAAQDALSRRQLELEQDLIASGMSPAEAEVMAAEEILGLPAKRRARASLGAARAAAPPVSYGNAATLDNLDGASGELVVEDILGGPLSRPSVPQSERVFKDDPTGGLAAMVAAREAEPTPMGTRVPGPVDLGTGQSEAGEPMFSEEEVAAYELRQPAGNEAERAAAQLMGGGPYRGGDFMPSQEDEDMYRRGMVYTINPQTGEGGYSVAYPQMNEAGTPGAPGRLGTRNDLRGPVRDAATGGYLRGTNKYEKTVRDSPLGQVEVYAPTDEFRRELAARDLLRRRQRLMDRAGLTGAQGEPDPSSLDLNQLRALGDTRRAQEKAARRQALQRMRMAQTNPLEYMNRGDISDWNRMVAADRLSRGGYRGATPLDVDQARESAKAALQARLAMQPGQQQLTPEQREMLQARNDAGKPVQVRAQEAVAAGRMNDPSILQHADDLVHAAYSSRPGAMGVSTHFTDNEVALAAQRLADDTGLSYEQAEGVMRRIQQDRNQNMPASRIASWIYDR